jgi:hypothetical protein
MRTRLVKRGIMDYETLIDTEVLVERGRGDLKQDVDSSPLSGCRMSIGLLHVLLLYSKSPPCILSGTQLSIKA